MQGCQVATAAEHSDVALFSGYDFGCSVNNASHDAYHIPAGSV